MTASANRCLSDLPDDLLRHILSFAPAREAAATAVISRRWRSLWRTCGAINIDSRSCGRRLNNSETRRRFFRGAMAALAAARAPVKRLTLYVELETEDHAELGTTFLLSPSDRAKQELHGMIDAVLSNPAARRVEELRIGAQKFHRASTVAHEGWGLRELSFGAGHPSEALRVLHVTNCSRFTPPPPGTSSFPKLSEMRLRGCGASHKELQGMIDNAPQLATLQLESVCLSSDDEETTLDDSRAKDKRCYRLRCPAVTALVLENCEFPWSARDGIELDMPRLIYLRFKGLVSRQRQRLSLKSYFPLLDRVDLHFTDDVCQLSGDENNKVRVPFWHFLGNFSNAKVLKLKLDYPIDRIAVVENKLDALLGDKLFSNLQYLEIEGTYQASSEASGFAMGNLLHCCPVVQELWVKLSKTQPNQTTSCSLRFAKLKAQSDFEESVDHFKQHRISLGEDGDDDSYEVSDIPGLSDHSFNCMHKHLRRVSLQFWSEEPNCFVAQLARFFALNAVVLEEMHIDDGNSRSMRALERQGWEMENQLITKEKLARARSTTGVR